ncbi:MAG: DUF47 domain-containing protein [Dehalococcoidales bacterium]|nr:DUF47 domain-containing protein [Dehalococcoidales bacterium]
MVKLSLVPREEKFRDLFIEGAQNTVKAAQALRDLVYAWTDVEARINAITDLEHAGDNVTHQIMSRLHRTFFTSFDREDIALLSHTLDDVTDFIHSSADAMLIYKIDKPAPRAKELADIILESAKQVEGAMLLLKGGTLDFKELLRFCVEINRLENAADRVYRAALGELFDNPDLAQVIKWREIYEHMESATDRCEDVANVLEGIAIKNA